MKTANEVAQIKNLIAKAEAESLKAQGALDSIKAEWVRDYGTDDVAVIEAKRKELEEQHSKLISRRTAVMDKITGMYDWDKLAESL